MSGLTSDEITLLNVKQLKFAWQQERDSRMAESAIVEQLKGELAERGDVLAERELELNLSNARAELALLCNTYPSDPCLLISAVQSFLPQKLQEDVSLTCFVRVGDSWACLHSSIVLDDARPAGKRGYINELDVSYNGDNSDSESTGMHAPHVVQSPDLDRIAHDSTSGSAASLRSIGITRQAFCNIMGFDDGEAAFISESKHESFQGYATESDYVDDIRRTYGQRSPHQPVDINYDEVLKTSYCVVAMTRCMWFVVPRDGSLFNGSHDTPAKFPGSNSAADGGDHALDQVRASCSEASSLLTQEHWFGFLKTSSQLAMAALVSQRAAVTAWIHRTSFDGLQALNRHIFSTASIASKSGVEAQASWQQCVAILGGVFPTCELSIFIASPPAPGGRYTLVDHRGRAHSSISERTAMGCLVTSVCLLGKVRYSHNHRDGGVLPLDYEIDGNGDDSNQSFLGVPLWPHGQNTGAGVALFRCKDEIIPAHIREAIVSLMNACSPSLQAWMTANANLVLNPLSGAYVITAAAAASAAVAANSISAEHEEEDMHHLHGVTSSPNIPYSPEVAGLKLRASRGHSMHPSELNVSPSPVKTNRLTRSQYLGQSDAGSRAVGGSALVESAVMVQNALEKVSLTQTLVGAVEGSKRPYTELLAKVPQLLKSYMDLDWVLTFTLEANDHDTESKTPRMCLLNSAGGEHIDFQLDDSAGILHELVQWLMYPPVEEDGATSAKKSGLAAAHVEHSMFNLSASGLPALLLASMTPVTGVQYSSVDIDMLDALPPQACPLLGARLDYYSTSPSGSTPDSESNLSLLVVAGRFWRALELDEVLPKLREVGSLFELALDLRASEGMTQAIYATAKGFESQVEKIRVTADKENFAQKSVDSFCKELQSLESDYERKRGGNHMGFESEISATISFAAAAKKVGSAGHVTQKKMRMDVQAIKEDGYRQCRQLRLSLVQAVQSFLPKMYNIPNSTAQSAPTSPNSASSEDSTDDFMPIGCQLVLSETVAEEAIVRLWILDSGGSWVFVQASENFKILSSIDDSTFQNITDEDLRVVVSNGFNVTSAEKLIDLYTETCHSHRHDSEDRDIQRSLSLKLKIWAIIGSFPTGRWDRSILLKDDDRTNTIGKAVELNATKGSSKKSQRRSKTKSSKSKGSEEHILEVGNAPVWKYQEYLESSWYSHLSSFVSHHSREFIAHEDSLGLLYSAHDNSAVRGRIETQALDAYRSYSNNASSSNVQSTLENYLGDRKFLRELRGVAPEFALIPIKISCSSSRRGSLDYSVKDLRFANSSIGGNDVESRSDDVPDELSDIICEATQSTLCFAGADPEYEGVGRGVEFRRHSFQLVTGGRTNKESSLTLLNDQGVHFHDYYIHGNQNASGSNHKNGQHGDLTVPEFEQVQAAAELSPRSRVMLYLSPSNISDWGAQGRRDDDRMCTVGFLVGNRNSHLISPSYLRSLMSILDSACLPFRLLQSMLPMFNIWLNPEKFLLSAVPQSPFITPRKRKEPVYTIEQATKQQNVGSDVALVFEEKASAPSGSGVTMLPSLNNGTMDNVVETWFACSQQEISRICMGDGGQTPVNSPKETCIRSTAFLLSPSDTDFPLQSSSSNPWAMKMLTEDNNGPHSRLKDIYSAEQEHGYASNPLPYSSTETSGPIFENSHAHGGATVANLPAVTGAKRVRQSGGTYATKDIFRDVGFSTDNGMAGVEVGFEDRLVEVTGGSSFEGISHSLKPSTLRLVRLFVTVPLEWVQSLVLRPGEEPQRQRGHLYGNDRCVISALCFWFESGQDLIPTEVKSALIRSTAHVACLLSNAVLEAVRIHLIQEELVARLERACFRAEAQAGVLSGIYDSTLRGLEVGSQMLKEHAQELNIPGGAASLDAFGMLDELSKLKESGAVAGTATVTLDDKSVVNDDDDDNGDDSVSKMVHIGDTIAPYVGSFDTVLGLRETQWMHKTLNAATTVSTVMATAMAQLNDERANVLSLRKEKASLSVRLRNERQMLMKFVFTISRLLPGGELLAARAKAVLALPSAHSARQDSKLPSSFLEEIVAAVDLTSQALSGVLERLTPLALREEASRVLIKMSSYALFDKLHIRDNLREDAGGGDNPIEISEIEKKITSNGLVIWCDCNPAPDAQGPEHDKYVPMKGVIRPDLLLLAWRRGIPASGSVAAHQLYHQVESGLGPHECYFVEYIPVNLKNFQKRNRMFLRQPGIMATEDLTSEFPIAIVQYVSIMPSDIGDADTTKNSSSDPNDEKSRMENIDEVDEENQSSDTINKSLQRTIRGWLESLLREMVPKTRGGGICHQNVTSKGISSIALRALMHSHRRPLEVVPMSASHLHHFQHQRGAADAHIFHSYQKEAWAPFSLAAGSLIASNMRGCGILFHPHSSDDNSEELWGVASKWEHGGVEADNGPLTLTVEMWKRLKEKQDSERGSGLPGHRHLRGGAHADPEHPLHAAAVASEMDIIGPMLVHNMFHGTGDKCLLAVSFPVEGYEHSNWVAMCLTDELLNDEDVLMLTSIAELFQAMAANRIIRASHEFKSHHLEMMSGHLTNQTTDAMLFRELWSFLDSLYAVPVVHVQDLSVPIKQMRHLVLEELPKLINVPRMQMVPVHGSEVVEIMSLLVSSNHQVSGAAASLTGHVTSQQFVRRKHGAHCIATGTIVHQREIRARDGTEVFWIPVTELNNENEAFDALVTKDDIESKSTELSRTMWAIQLWAHPTSHMYKFLTTTQELRIIRDSADDTYNDNDLYQDVEAFHERVGTADKAVSEDVVRTLQSDIENDITGAKDAGNFDKVIENEERAHGKSLYEIFTVCVQGIRQHLHLVDLRVSHQHSSRLKSFDDTVNKSCANVIETLGILVGNSSVRSYAAIGASLAKLTPDPPYTNAWHNDQPVLDDDCTLLARLHFKQGTTWLTVEVEQSEIEGEPLNAAALKQRHRAKFADSDDESQTSGSIQNVSISSKSSDSEKEDLKDVDGYEEEFKESKGKEVMELLEEVSEILTKSDWIERPSGISKSMLDRVSSELNSENVDNKNSHKVNVTTYDDSKSEGNRRRKSDQHKIPGKSTIDVCLDVSSSGQRAVLEISLLVSTKGLESKIGGDVQEKMHQNLVRLVSDGSIMLLGRHVSQIVGLVHSMQDHAHTSDSFNRTLDLARENALVLASCLNELCNEGKASTALDYTLESEFAEEKLESGDQSRDTLLKTSSYIEIMLARTQREILKLPGVYGVTISSWDTLEKLQLYKRKIDCHSNKDWLCSDANKSCMSEKTLMDKFDIDVRKINNVTSEFSFECGEISGILALQWLDSHMAIDGSSIINGHESSNNHTVSDEKMKRFGGYSKRHRDETAHLIASIVKSMARRIFELHRGHHNKKLMIMQQRNLSRLKADLGRSQNDLLNMESSKSVIKTQQEELNEQVKKLEAELVTAKKSAEELKITNKKLTDRSVKMTGSIRAEYTKELTELKDVLERREKELLEEIGRREAVIDHMRSERAKELAEEAHRDWRDASGKPITSERVIAAAELEAAAGAGPGEGMPKSQFTTSVPMSPGSPYERGLQTYQKTYEYYKHPEKTNHSQEKNPNSAKN